VDSNVSALFKINEMHENGTWLNYELFVGVQNAAAEEKAPKENHTKPKNKLFDLNLARNHILPLDEVSLSFLNRVGWVTLGGGTRALKYYLELQLQHFKKFVCFVV
jgi:hypothetical protein